ncbi:protein-glutamate methylesterase/protein-glutamine glutaminase [Asticcacaulis tiandongensis]|uniref:protein-glutamate methylesterase/protein-glutamine glutaminase n=1 Tax=Asticcacaulis tiandongensis TaxID=2565365 RepID=UPI001126E137|nr:chemotaxis response regulator protein-glutamate methylesterase [Asticcacaulis tiandongensis]
MSLNPHTAASLRPLRVMIVDDSAVVRGLVTRWVEHEDDMVLAGSATDGAKGIEKVRELQPDVLILDIEMPNMGGLEALPKLIAAKPGLKVLMASTLSTRGATVTLRALELGAADYIPKPESTRIGGAEGFRVELLTKIRALCGRTRLWPIPPQSQAQSSPTTPTSLRAPTPHAPVAVAPPVTPKPVVLAPRIRHVGPRRVEALVIGASTGGPPALRSFLMGLGPDWRLPIFIVQHMPAAFTTILAEHLDKALDLKVLEATDGMTVQPRHVYIAPGDFHMRLKGSSVAPVIKLDQGPQINWCRPAVDPLFTSAVDVYGKNLIAVVLTGMGHDGRDGAKVLSDAGATIMAQDEATSVVWGMPGAVAEAGLAELIKPVAGLSAACKAFARGEKVQ